MARYRQGTRLPQAAKQTITVDAAVKSYLERHRLAGSSKSYLEAHVIFSQGNCQYCTLDLTLSGFPNIFMNGPQRA
jgi:hypothetical protein